MAEEKENQPENNKNEASVDAGAGAVASTEYAMRQSTKSFKSSKSGVT